MSFWIITDSCSDLPRSYINAQADFTVLPLSYLMDGQSFIDHSDDAETKAFYDKMRAGKISTTAQINEQTWLDNITPLLKEGHDVLCVVFSSGLSGTYSSCRMAVEDLRSQYPNRKIYAIDTLAASMGEGLMVHYALKCRNKDCMTIEDTYQWLNDNKLHFSQWFTVNDLVYLMRGGRVSAVSAYMAGILNIKPVLHVDTHGHLTPVEKVQGRKRSLRAIVDRMVETATNPGEHTVFISHGDCEDEAKWIAESIAEKVKPAEIVVAPIGPIIGSHSGPGTIAVFWYASER